VTDTVLVRARSGDENAFKELTEPHRRELQLHCYRILGSVPDAEETVQETLLAAWRGLEGFQERASLRSWLYRIATNRCLNMLRDASRGKRAAQTALTFQPPAPTRLGEPNWVEPYPDVLLEGITDCAPGPEARYETREAVELAFLSTLQTLPPRQRTALVLRDVLGFHTSEVADLLDSSEASVKGALQRARAAIESRQGVAERERPPLPGATRERELVGRFADAFENGDVDGVVSLLTDDAWMTMPPMPLEYQGHEVIAAFLGEVFRVLRDRPIRLVPTRANTQPAFGVYVSDSQTPLLHAMGLLVLTLEGEAISAITRFDNSVIPPFGLPRTLPNHET
jgi:RNA polymerase sigma-70 factor (TIGR02960 family)